MSRKAVDEGEGRGGKEVKEARGGEGERREKRG
jgi:hypothetical protein